MSRSAPRGAWILSLPPALLIPLIPLAVWIVAGVGLLSLFDENDPEDTGMAAILLVVLGAVFVAVLSGFIGGLVGRRWAADDWAFDNWVADDEAEDGPPVSPYHVDDLIPEEHREVWQALCEQYDDDFATWIIDQAEPGSRADDLRRLASRRRDDWLERPEQIDVARHEAAHATVGMALGRIPRVVSIWVDDDEFVGETILYSPKPAIDPVDLLWQNLLVAIAGLTVQAESAAPLRGTDIDRDQAAEIALELVASGRRPRGFTGELTVEGCLRRAASETSAILARHAAALSALTSAVDEHLVLGGHDVRKVFADNPPTAAQRTPDAASL